MWKRKKSFEAILWSHLKDVRKFFFGKFAKLDNSSGWSSSIVVPGPEPPRPVGELQLEAKQTSDSVWNRKGQKILLALNVWFTRMWLHSQCVFVGQPLHLHWVFHWTAVAFQIVWRFLLIWNPTLQEYRVQCSDGDEWQTVSIIEARDRVAEFLLWFRYLQMRLHGKGLEKIAHTTYVSKAPHQAQDVGEGPLLLDHKSNDGDGRGTFCCSESLSKAREEEQPLKSLNQWKRAKREREYTRHTSANNLKPSEFVVVWRFSHTVKGTKCASKPSEAICGEVLKTRMLLSLWHPMSWLGAKICQSIRMCVESGEIDKDDWRSEMLPNCLSASELEVIRIPCATCLWGLVGSSTQSTRGWSAKHVMGPGTVGEFVMLGGKF